MTYQYTEHQNLSFEVWNLEKRRVNENGMKIDSKLNLFSPLSLPGVLISKILKVISMELNSSIFSNTVSYKFYICGLNSDWDMKF